MTASVQGCGISTPSSRLGIQSGDDAHAEAKSGADSIMHLKHSHIDGVAEVADGKDDQARRVMSKQVVDGAGRQQTSDTFDTRDGSRDLFPRTASCMYTNGCHAPKCARDEPKLADTDRDIGWGMPYARSIEPASTASAGKDGASKVC